MFWQTPMISGSHSDIHYLINNDTVCVVKIYSEKESLLQAWTGPEDSRKLRLPDFKKINT